MADIMDDFLLGSLYEPRYIETKHFNCPVIINCDNTCHLAVVESRIQRYSI